MGYVIYIGNRTYTSIEKLGRDIASSWDFVKLHLFNGDIRSEINQLDPVLANKIHICEHIVSKDRAVFVLQYLLCPNLPFTYKELTYDDLSKMGADILRQAPYVNKLIADAVEFKMVSDFMKLKEIDKNYPKHFEEVVQVEGEFNNDKLRSYFKMGFLLSENKGLVYDSKIFTDEKSFFNYLLAHKKIEDFASKSENFKYLEAWLSIQGHQEKVDEWLQKICTIESWK